MVSVHTIDLTGTRKVVEFCCMLGRWEDISSRLLINKSKTGVENISAEIKLRRKKWFLNCSYNPNRNLISSHLECLNYIMGEFSKNYENVIFLGDFNTCINDNAMMVVTELKMEFQKLKLHIVANSDYKHVDNETFWSDIQSCASGKKNLKCFKETAFCLFNKYVPVESRYVRTKVIIKLHKVIMKRSRLRNKFLKTKSITDRKNYNAQRNYCKKTLLAI